VRAIVVVLVMVALGGAAAVWMLSTGGGADATGASAAIAGAADCDAVEFDRYDAGAAVDGFTKGKTTRQCEPDVGAPTRLNMVVTVYGSCNPPGSDGGCAPPLQVQSWPSCEHNLALYEKYPGRSTKKYTRTTIRVVPATILQGGRRIELYTAKTTLVVFGERAALTAAAAERLTGVHQGRVVRATDDLPEPAAGALEGKLAC